MRTARPLFAQSALLSANLALLGSIAAAGGALGPGEFQVNTTTEGDQKYPAVAMDDGGNFVVVWESPGQADGRTLSDIFAQRFDATGRKLGSEFRVNTSSKNSQRLPAIAIDRASGNFLVVWTQSDFGFGSASAIGQAFDALGNKLGGEVEVTSVHAFDPKIQSAVAADASSGDFVVVWSADQPGGSLYTGDVFARRFDRSGRPLDSGFRVDAPGGDYVSDPAVATDAFGDFIATWVDFGSVEGRRLAHSGVPLGAEFTVGVADYASGTSVAVAPSGNFVIVWGAGSPDSSGWPGPSCCSYSVTANAFDRAGGPLGDRTWFSTDAGPTGTLPRAALNTTGDFLVAWPSDLGVMGQRLGSSVEPIGSEFLIAPGSVAPRSLGLGSSRSGKAVVVWEARGGKDGSGSGIFARLLELRVPGTPCVPSPGILCLDSAPGDRRFEVTVTYPTPGIASLTTSALAVPLAGAGLPSAGLFAIFDPKTPDVMVKLLDACALSHTRWFFLSGGTDMGFTVKATDTLTGLTRVYANPYGKVVSPVEDLNAFPCP